MPKREPCLPIRSLGCGGVAQDRPELDTHPAPDRSNSQKTPSGLTEFDDSRAYNILAVRNDRSARTPILLNQRID